MKFEDSQNPAYTKVFIGSQDGSRFVMFGKDALQASGTTGDMATMFSSNFEPIGQPGQVQWKFQNGGFELSSDSSASATTTGTAVAT